MASQAYARDPVVVNTVAITFVVQPPTVTVCAIWHFRARQTICIDTDAPGVTRTS